MSPETQTPARGETTPAPTKEAEPGAASEEQAPPSRPSRKPPRKLIMGVGGLVLLMVMGYGIHAILWGRTHVSTDDAYVTGNLVNVSPMISGTLEKLTVDEGDPVKKGQLIARLDDSAEMATLRQAKAAYQAALTEVPQARASLAYQKAATEADIARARAMLAQRQSQTAGARQQVTMTTGAVRHELSQAEARAAQADAQVAAKRASLRAARQGVETARRQAAAAAANVPALRAAADKAARDVQRYASLLQDQEVAQQVYDAALVASRGATAALQAGQEQVRQARSQVAQATDNAAAATAQLTAAEHEAAAAHAAVGIATANTGQVGIQQSNFQGTSNTVQQAQADLRNAQAGREQVALREKVVETREAQARQAAATLANAEVQERYTYVYAPSDGTVVKKLVNAGTALSPGQGIVIITQGHDVWITANLKETQMNGVKPRQTVETEVDAFPGKIFLGTVDSIMDASGNAMALLPADNATGNFTKVVQRIPVKIVLEAAPDNAPSRYARAADLLRLRQGMSAVPVINIGSR